MTSASVTSSRVARKAATRSVGSFWMKPTVSVSRSPRPVCRSRRRVVGSRVANSFCSAWARPRERVEQGRLAGVGVADDRRRLQLGAPAAGSLLVPLRAHLLDLALEIAHALADASAFDLDLLLTETAAGSHPTSAATDLAVVCVGADQPGEQMVKA